MRHDSSTWLHPAAITIQRLLRNIDELRLPIAARWEAESILVQRAANELDRALTWQQGHGLRTAILAGAIGSIAGLDAEALHRLKLASWLHDIGLLVLPSPLFSETAYWSSDEYADVQCHPRVGAEFLSSFRFLREPSVLIAHHHERWDGTGYPYGLRGRFIPMGARILAIADAFDAIRVPGADSQRARDRVAYRILRVASGTQFDPELVEVCGRYLELKESRPEHARDMVVQYDLQHSTHQKEGP